MRKVSLLKIILSLLLSAIMIAGFVACGGVNDLTGSASQTDTITPETPETPEPPPDGGGDKIEDLGDNNGDSGNKWNIWETKGQTFAADTYVDIYVPFVSPYWFKVSYKDTNRLDRMWKSMIDNQQKNGRRRMFIHTTSSGDLYFDQDYNIRWTKRKNVVLKKFHGGVITKLRVGAGNADHSYEEYVPASSYTAVNGNGRKVVVVKKNPNLKFSGRYVLGGLYSYALNLREVNKFNNDRLNEFFGALASHTSHDSLKAGRIEIMALHPGYPVDLYTGQFWVQKGKGPDSGWWGGLAYALQTIMPNTYKDIGTHYDKIRGKHPEEYLSIFNVTHQLYLCGLRWSNGKDYSPWNFWYYNESQNW